MIGLFHNTTARTFPATIADMIERDAQLAAQSAALQVCIARTKDDSEEEWARASVGIRDLAVSLAPRFVDVMTAASAELDWCELRAVGDRAIPWVVAEVLAA